LPAGYVVQDAGVIGQQPEQRRNIVLRSEIERSRRKQAAPDPTVVGLLQLAWFVGTHAWLFRLVLVAGLLIWASASRFRTPMSFPLDVLISMPDSFGTADFVN